MPPEILWNHRFIEWAHTQLMQKSIAESRPTSQEQASPIPRKSFTSSSIHQTAEVITVDAMTAISESGAVTDAGLLVIVNSEPQDPQQPQSTVLGPGYSTIAASQDLDSTEPTDDISTPSPSFASWSTNLSTDEFSSGPKDTSVMASTFPTLNSHGSVWLIIPTPINTMATKTSAMQTTWNSISRFTTTTRQGSLLLSAGLPVSDITVIADNSRFAAASPVPSRTMTNEPIPSNNNGRSRMATNVTGPDPHRPLIGISESMVSPPKLFSSTLPPLSWEHDLGVTVAREAPINVESPTLPTQKNLPHSIASPSSSSSPSS